MIAAEQGSWVLPAALALRTLTIAVIVIIGLRLFGKRQLGQLNIADLAAIMAIANGVQNAMTHGTGLLTGGMASAATLLVMAAGLAFLVRRFPRLERRIVGSPFLLVWDGHVLPERVRRAAMTEEEVEAAVREHGFASLSDVRSAVLEVDGSISVVSRDDTHRIHHQALPPPSRGPGISSPAPP
jgi:uncharacterized membrane protein YcaP (DUF421 family)